MTRARDTKQVADPYGHFLIYTRRTARFTITAHGAGHDTWTAPDYLIDGPTQAIMRLILARYPLDCCTRPPQTITVHGYRITVPSTLTPDQMGEDPDPNGEPPDLDDTP